MPNALIQSWAPDTLAKDLLCIADVRHMGAADIPGGVQPVLKDVVCKWAGDSSWALLVLHTASTSCKMMA